MVWPWPMGSGLFSQANSTSALGTKASRGTLRMASITASAKTGRPVSAPVSCASRAIASSIVSGVALAPSRWRSILSARPRPAIAGGA